MQTTRSRKTIFSTVLRIVYINMLLSYLLLWVLNANGQTSKQAGLLRCAYPPPAPVRMAQPGGGVGGGLTSKQDLVQKIYTSQLGVRETQPNSGPEVGKYLRYVNLPKGNPWCAAFVCWTLWEAGLSNPRSGWSPALFGERYVIWGKGAESGKLKACLAGSRCESVHRYAYSPQVLHPGESIRLIYAPTQTSDFRPPTSDTRRFASPPSLVTGNWQLTTDPQAGKTPPSNPPTPTTGDVFGLFFAEKGRIAHVGFIDQWDDPWVTTVEGNTNVLGSREGDGVYRKRRLVRSIYKVARYVE